MTRLDDRPLWPNRVNRAHGFSALAWPERKAGAAATGAYAGSISGGSWDDPELPVRPRARNPEPFRSCVGASRQSTAGGSCGLAKRVIYLSFAARCYLNSPPWMQRRPSPYRPYSSAVREQTQPQRPPSLSAYRNLMPTSLSRLHTGKEQGRAWNISATLSRACIYVATSSSIPPLGGLGPGREQSDWARRPIAALLRPPLMLRSCRK